MDEFESTNGPDEMEEMDLEQDLVDEGSGNENPNRTRNIVVGLVVTILLLIACGIFAFLLVRLAQDGGETPTMVPTAEVPAIGTEVPPGTDPVWARIQESGRIVVGTSADYPPFEYYTDEFLLDGFDIALIYEIGNRLGLSVEIKDMAFDGLGAALQVEQIDMAISAISYTPERDAEIDFSNIYYVSEDALLANAESGIDSIPSEDQLTGVRVGAQTGTVYDNWLQTNLVDTGQIPQENLILYQNIDRAVEDLAAGQIDLVALDLEPAKVAEEQGGVKIVGQGLNRQRFAMAVPDGALVLQSELNRALFQLQGDGTVTRLLGRYLGLEPEEIPPIPTPDPSQPTPTPPPVAPGPCVDAMAYVSDLNLDDQDMESPPQMAPGQEFQKGWRVRNSGTCTWDSTYSLTPVGGNNPAARMGGVPAPVQGQVQPGQTYDFYVDLVTPLAPGIYQEFWTMRAPSGILFGDRIWVGVEVVPNPTATPAPTQTPTGQIAFSADPTQIQQGGSSVLTWQTENVKEVYLYPQGQPWNEYGVPGNGQRTVYPAQTTTYELRVVQLNNTVEIRQVTVFVTPTPGAPVINRFTVDPPYEIAVGQCVIVQWQVSGTVDSVTITRNTTAIWSGGSLSGSIQDCPPGTGEQVYTLQAVGPGGTSRQQLFLNVVQPVTPVPSATPTQPGPTEVPAPVIQAFEVIPNQIAVGSCVITFWQVGGGAQTVQILRNGSVVLDNAPFSGSAQDCPASVGSYTYSVEASNSAGGQASESETISVVESTPENPLEGTSWQLQFYFNGSAEVAPLEGSVISASFLADGQLAGFAGCNVYGAEYLLSGDTIAINSITASRKTCTEPAGVAEQEAEYLAILGSAATFQIADGQLTISDGSGQPILGYAELVATPS
jgi:ABC-type amino acid transport substrate-binding protein/heat shock protein HslJ